MTKGHEGTASAAVRGGLIAVIGNPNCGKSTLFNALTGEHRQVGNWSGVTVGAHRALVRLEGAELELIDLPGVYSLEAGSGGLDEDIARSALEGEAVDVVLNIVDASNLERHLYLTAQLLERGLPLVIALNMTDVARAKGLQIDAAALQERLGVPVVSLVASRGEGIAELQAALALQLSERRVSPLKPVYDAALEQRLREAEARMPGQTRGQTIAQWMAEGDEAQQTDLALQLADGRYTLAHQLAQVTARRLGQFSQTASDRIDRVVLNRWLGVPIFLAAMYLLFMLAINVGGAFIDFFDLSAAALLVEGPKAWLAGAPEWLLFLLADGIGAGIQLVLTFVPVIAALYLFLAILEESGYLSRAAVVSDRVMRAAGLPGKAFVPMVVGFGCNVPAVYATRVLERRRDRILATLMTPFMSCGARLPVYALFAAAFFPVGGQNVVFALYLIGIALAVMTGMILRRTVLRGEPQPLLLELPAWQWPSLGAIWQRTVQRTGDFVFGAGRYIVPMVIVIQILSSVGSDGRIGVESVDQSLLARTGEALTPVFAPMGVQPDNWPAVAGVITGVLAKEVVVGTLDASYSVLAAEDARQAVGSGTAVADEAAPAEGQSAFALWPALTGAVATVPTNLADAMGGWNDPLGLNIGEVGDTTAAAAEQGVSAGTFGAMQTRFDGTVGAFAYLLFILLYFPCVAVVGAIARELSAAWAAFSVAWTTGLAYGVATLFYQLATFAAHPASSLAWTIGVLLVFAGVIFALHWLGRQSAHANDEESGSAWLERGPA